MPAAAAELGGPPTPALLHLLLLLVLRLCALHSTASAGCRQGFARRRAMPEATTARAEEASPRRCLLEVAPRADAEADAAACRQQQRAAARRRIQQRLPLLCTSRRRRRSSAEACAAPSSASSPARSVLVGAPRSSGPSSCRRRRSSSTQARRLGLVSAPLAHPRRRRKRWAEPGAETNQAGRCSRVGSARIPRQRPNVRERVGRLVAGAAARCCGTKASRCSHGNEREGPRSAGGKRLLDRLKRCSLSIIFGARSGGETRGTATAARASTRAQPRLIVLLRTKHSPHGGRARHGATGTANSWTAHPQLEA